MIRNPAAGRLCPGGVGTVAAFQLVIDTVGQTAYFVYDFGSGPQQSSMITLAGLNVSAINEVELLDDFRYTDGGESATSPSLKLPSPGLWGSCCAPDSSQPPGCDSQGDPCRIESET